MTLSLGLDFIGMGAFTPGNTLLNGSEADGTNILTGGLEDFTSGWSALNVTLTANNTTAPNGATTAARILEDVTNDRHGVELFIVASANTSYTCSIYAKSITRRYLSVAPTSSGGRGIYGIFDLQTGVVVSTGTTSPDGSTAVGSSSCQAGANGFYKCTISGVLDASAGNFYLKLYLSDISNPGTPNYPSYAGNTSNGAYLWRPKVV